MNLSPPFCYRCRKQPARAGKTRCAECAKRDAADARAYHLRRFAALLAVDPSAGVRKIRMPCAGCGAARAAGRYRCAVHLAEDAVALKARRARSRAEHRCYYCKLPAREGRTTCAVHAGNPYETRRRRRLT